MRDVAVAAILAFVGYRINERWRLRGRYRSEIVEAVLQTYSHLGEARAFAGLLRWRSDLQGDHAERLRLAISSKADHLERLGALHPVASTSKAASDAALRLGLLAATITLAARFGPSDDLAQAVKDAHDALFRLRLRVSPLRDRFRLWAGKRRGDW